jgi:hypothetical protein
MPTFRELIDSRSENDKTDFSGVDISNEELESQQFTSCLFNGVSCRDTTGHKLECSHAEFADTLFDGCNFEDCQFDNSDFVNAHLKNCSFIRCSFVNGEWRSSKIENCNFESCDFIDATVCLCGFVNCNFKTKFLTGNVSHGKRYNVLLNCSMSEELEFDSYDKRNYLIFDDSYGSPNLVGTQVKSTLFLLNHLIEQIKIQLSVNQTRERSLRIKHLVLTSEILVQNHNLPIVGIEIFAQYLVSQVVSETDTEAFLDIVRLVAICRSYITEEKNRIDTSLEALQDIKADRLVAELTFDKDYEREEVEDFIKALLILSNCDRTVLEDVSIVHGSTILTLVIGGILGVAALVKSISFLLAKTTDLIEQCVKLKNQIDSLQSTKNCASPLKRQHRTNLPALAIRNVIRGSDNDPYMTGVVTVAVELEGRAVVLDGNVSVRISIEQGMNRAVI